jgi:hypothetical protein
MASATLIGTLGAPVRARISPWGEIHPCDGSPAVDWWIAADDRWHAPRSDPTRRQRRHRGTPVVETLVAVPGGDVVHRAYAFIVNGRGVLAVELDNQSPLPVAIAFSRSDVTTGRPLAPLPPDAPTGARVAVPVAHRSVARAVVGPWPGGAPAAEQVARGWLAQTETGARYELPDQALMERIVEARADALLAAPDDADPIDLALTVRERCRLGEAAPPWVGRVRDAALAIARAARRRPSWDAVAALDAVGDVLYRAGEVRGADDVSTIVRRLPAPPPDPAHAPDGVRLIAWLERRLVRWPSDSDAAIDLLPGYSEEWSGQNVAAYELRQQSRTLAFAVRWHDQRPALLWELNEPGTLTCRRLDPSWSSRERRGEVLLRSAP